jgi:hypothetical protein
LSEQDSWRVEDVDGRVVRAIRRPEDAEISVGDKVVIEPMFQSTAGSRLNLVPNWIIVEKLR